MPLNFAVNLLVFDKEYSCCHAESGKTPTESDEFCLKRQPFSSTVLNRLTRLTLLQIRFITHVLRVRFFHSLTKSDVRRMIHSGPSGSLLYACSV